MDNPEKLASYVTNKKTHIYSYSITMKNLKKYHSVSTVPKFNRNLIERSKMDTQTPM